MKSVSIPGINKPHMSRKLSNAIMKRARLRNRGKSSQKDVDIQKYNLQGNLVVSMNREAERDFHRNLDLKKMGNEKDFCKTIKPLLSYKVKNTNTNIKLIENGHRITKRDEIAGCFNSYCTETITVEKAPTSEVMEPFSHPVADFIMKSRLHPSIVKIRQMTRENATFEFRPFEPAEVWDENNRWDMTKKTSGGVPSHTLKSISDLSFSAVAKLPNDMVQQCTFPDELKLADVSPVFKSGDTTIKQNYCPIRVLSSLSKVSDLLLLKQFLPFIEKRLSAILFAFKKGHSTQHTLFRVVEIVRHCIDKRGCHCHGTDGPFKGI